MRFALMIEPQQGLSYAEQLDIARLAERLAFDTFFRSDHYRSFPGPAGRPTTDAWTVLAGIARETTRIHLGALVSPVTFRHPGSFAKVVTTVDEMSGGRVEVGVGAGWNRAEHVEHGLPFPEIGERADLLEEELQVLRGFWGEPDGWSFQGRYLHVENAQFRPKPVQRPHPRIITGGNGKPRSLRIAARYCDEYNLIEASAEETVEVFGRLDDECRKIGRDPASLARSVMVGVLIGSHEAELTARTNALLEFVGIPGQDPRAYLDQRRRYWIVGTPDEARELAGRYAEAGAERIVLQDFLPRDHAMIELAGAELVGRV